MVVNKEEGDAVPNAKLWASLNLDSATLHSAQYISNEQDKVFCVWSQRDVVASRKRVFSTTHTRSGSGEFEASPPVEIQDPCTPEFYYSPSRTKFLKFSSKVVATEELSSPTIAELWSVDGGLERVWEIDCATHGTVFKDEWFGGVSWSPDETMVAYIADKPALAVHAAEGPQDQQESWTNPLQHKFHECARDRFGEGYASKRTPSLFIADLERGRSYAPLEWSCSVDHDVFLGEPQWSPDGRKIVATMRHTSHTDADMAPPDDMLLKDLGVRYCYNRYSAIMIFDAPKCAAELEGRKCEVRPVSSEDDPDDFCCSSPRFSSDGNSIIYLSAPRHRSEKVRGLVLPHNTTKVLRAVRVKDGETSPPCTLIGVPEDPERDEFPGLYLHSLLDNPWLDEKTVVFNCTWGSVNRVLSSSFVRDDGHLSPPADALRFTDWSEAAAKAIERSESGVSITGGTVSAVDVCDNRLLLCASNPASPSQLVAVSAGSGDGSDLVAASVTRLSKRARKLSLILQSAHTTDLVVAETDDKVLTGRAVEYIAGEHERHARFQVTVLLPASSPERSALLVYPHGGPHTATINGYSLSTAAFLKKGFAVMYVNYRGSVGLGQKSLETLPGNVGTQEIAEVVQATRWALDQPGYHLDSERVGFVGGSHSGFIGAHTSLIPGLFKRTVLRNPVVNIATMVGATDIPDWCFCEAAVRSRNANGVHLAPDAAQLGAMYERSPVSKVGPHKEARARPGPTLLQVGGSDRRVPPQQSVEWKWAMTQAYGSGSVSMRWYPGSGHAIDEVPNGDDAMVHALDFLDGL